jgi:catechol 2,3-dioxygenase-like lactoylglutathione lyase family enzyme
MTGTPKIFRVTLEVSNLDEAAAFYTKLLGTKGKRHPGSRHYFDCGGVVLARATELETLAPYQSMGSRPANRSSGPGASAPSTSPTAGATNSASSKTAR